MNNKISVIVPIYKVEKYLPKCVDSLINQTYKDLQIILVDDGSPDNCPKICDEYAKKDARITVIHKANGGLSDARNAGLPCATGEYISFIDSDDYVTPNFFEILFNTMQKEKSDICECLVQKVYEDTTLSQNAETGNISTYNSTKALSLLIEDKVFHQHVWNKLYKTAVIKNILFEKGKTNEDEFWTYQVFGKAKKISLIEKPMYCYLQRSGSIMAEGYNLKRLDALEAKFQRQQYIEKNYPQISVISKLNLYDSCIFSGQAVMKYMKNPQKKQAMNIIKKYKKSCVPTAEELKNYPNKKWINLSKFSFSLCCKIRAVTGIGF